VPTKRRYTVEYRESIVVYEAVWASSKAEAIRLVKEEGEGERLNEVRDDERGPTSFKVIEVED
jgi:hypothetical protein